MRGSPIKGEGRSEEGSPIKGDMGGLPSGLWSSPGITSTLPIGGHSRIC
jgi:hypothetical protein